MIPGSVSSHLLGAPAAAAGGISRSLRFNSSDSAYLSRTPASAGNRKTWTWAGWVKRSSLGSYQRIFNAWIPGVAQEYIRFDPNDNLRVFESLGTLITTQVFRDPSAWFHILVAVNTTDSTSSNRIKLYINGSQVTTFATATYPTQNADGLFNSAVVHQIGWGGNSTEYFNGYLADIYFIDGQQLDPSSFTETDATTGQLIPKAFSGSYGSQGWHLEFADNSAATAAALGKDTSGNGNNWTPNNLSVTAGAGNDSLVDVPTNGAQTDTGVGGEVRGNYCTLNPLESANTLSNGNLDVTSGSASWKISASTIYAQTGKWYCEFTLNAVQGYPQIGVYAAGSTFATSGLMGTSSTGYAYNSFNGNKINNNSSSAYGNSWTTGDTIGIAYDLDNGALYFSKNGTWQNSGVPTSGASKTGAAFSLPAGIFYTVAISAYGSDAGSFNFGQRQFAYTAPSGFKALCTANLPAPLVTKPSTVFDVKLYTGTGATQNITGLAFSPDLVWAKVRNTTGNHSLYDIIRGATQRLASSTTSAEATFTNSLTSFDSGGFSLGSNPDGDVNASGNTYVAWAWDAGSSTVTNTQGSITSSVRANASAGFSIVSFNSGSAGNYTVGHGLGAKPHLIIAKARNGSTFNWSINHISIATTVNKYLTFTTNGTLDNGAAAWGASLSDTNSTTFGISSANAVEASKDCIAYCFAPVVGYSSFGSFDGGSGVFVYTGFLPRWVLIKRSSSTSDWYIYDTARDTYNAAGKALYADLSYAEYDSPPRIDFVSNGFVTRASSGSEPSQTGTMVYAAFAQNPFNYARAR